MGNINTKETDTINWKSISTDKFDGNLKQYGGEESYRLSNESKLLLNRLNNAKVEKNIIINDKNFSDIFSPNFNENNKIISQLGGGNNIENSLSDTSPFISSEMYNILMKKNGDNIQVGGGMIEGDDSSTSSTSSSSDNKKKSTKKIKSVNKKYFSNKKSKSNETTPNDNSSAESKDLSYVSSSAHTEGNDSEGEHSNTESLPRTVPEKEEPSAADDNSSPVEDKTSSAEETSTPVVETPSPAEETPSPEKSKNLKDSETNNVSETNQQPTSQSESENKGDSNASTESEVKSSDAEETPIQSDTKQKTAEESSPVDSNAVSEIVTQTKTDNQSETLIDSHKTTENTNKLEKKGGYSKKKKNIRKKVNKKKIDSITNENSNLPPSSINTSDINMISDF
jgi:hypothetical protein